jgi:hypothetical protein
LLPSEALEYAGNLEPALHEHVSLIDEEEVGLNLVVGELHLLGLEVALLGLGKVSHEAIVVDIDGGAIECLEGGHPTFDEGLDSEWKRFRDLGKYEVGGGVDVDGVGNFGAIIASKALPAFIIPRVEADPFS